MISFFKKIGLIKSKKQENENTVNTAKARLLSITESSKNRTQPVNTTSLAVSTITEVEKEISDCLKKARAMTIEDCNGSNDISLSKIRSFLNVYFAAYSDVSHEQRIELTDKKYIFQSISDDFKEIKISIPVMIDKTTLIYIPFRICRDEDNNTIIK